MISKGLARFYHLQIQKSPYLDKLVRSPYGERSVTDATDTDQRQRRLTTMATKAAVDVYRGEP